MFRGAGRSAVFAALALALIAAAPASGAEWLAGDGHVHTCYSHDAYCGPGDDEGEDAFYSFGGSVAARFAEASLKGLDFLVISDHDDIRAHSDPAFGSQGVTGVHAYEASLADGHAQMIGARRPYPEGDGGSAATNALADALRADGGLFQANHPGYRLTGEPIKTCEEAAGDRMHWQYGFSVLPDTVEVWNTTALLRPAELFWECWLQRGARLGALAGSDSHGANHINIGLPTTWAYSASSRESDVLAALRAGRTTLSRVPPAQGAVRLLLEGDRDRNGSFESMIGDEVPPRTPLRVRSQGGPLTGFVRVRANGRTILDLAPLAPGQELRVTAPGEPGWVRATLYLRDGTQDLDPGCKPPEAPPISTCTEDLAVASMTSPIWVAPPAQGPKVDPPGPPKPGGPPDPDEQKPVPPSEGSGPPPDVPPQRGRAPRVQNLSASWYRGRRERPDARRRVRLRWDSPEGPWEVQARRKGSDDWSTLARRTSKRKPVFAVHAGSWVFRVRARPPFSKHSRWRSVGARL